MDHSLLGLLLHTLILKSDEGAEAMQYRYMYHPYYGSIAVPVSHSTEMEYPHVNGASTEQVNDPWRMKNEMPIDPRKKSSHTHGHLGATTCQDGHVHMHPGVTSKPIEAKGSHIHKAWGNTTFDDGHTHYYEAYTGPAIPLPNGYHTHYVEIQTTKNDGHIHIIKGFTEPSKS